MMKTFSMLFGTMLLTTGLFACGGTENELGDDEGTSEAEVRTYPGSTVGTKCQLNGTSILCPSDIQGDCAPGIATVTFTGSTCTVTINGLVYQGTTIVPTYTGSR